MRLFVHIVTCAPVLGFSAATAYAQVDRDQILRDAATSTVALYDEMKACMATPEFQTVGFSPDGPCTAMTARISEVVGFSDFMLRAGYPCHANFLLRIVSDNFDGYGGNGTPPFGTINPEFAAKFEDCRQKLEG